MSAAHDVITIDCQYLGPDHAAAYLITANGRALFVDNNTSNATPLLLAALEEQGLTPEHVDYAIITHLHLDHAAGTASLLRECPNARVLCHPRAERHLVDPSRLVAGVKQVYGEELFTKLYGTVEAVAAERVQPVADGETLPFGDRTLTFLHTRGHANHHIAIHDSASNGVFTGDTFGVSFPAMREQGTPFLQCSCPPSEFDPEESRRTVRRILDTGADRAYLSHFGMFEAVKEGADQLLESIDRMEAVLDKAVATGLEGDALEAFCHREVVETVKAHAGQCGLSPESVETLAADMNLNGKGIAYAARRRKR